MIGSANNRVARSVPTATHVHRPCVTPRRAQIRTSSVRGFDNFGYNLLSRFRKNHCNKRGRLMRWLPALLLILSVSPAFARNSKQTSAQTIPADKFHENKILRVGFDLYYRTE